MYIKTEGIVLRSTNIKETDKLLTVLTRDEGKLTLKARGVRTKGSKLKSSCQLLAFSEFTIFENKGYYTINEADPKELFTELRDDIEALAIGSYFAELTEAVSDEDWSNPDILSLILNSLYALGKLKKPKELVKAAFELRLIGLAGYEPLLDACAVCGNESPGLFNVTEGVLCCAGCENEIGEGATVPLCDGSLAALRHITYGDSKRLFSFSLGKEAMSRLNEACEVYLLAQLDRSFKTLDFYKSIQTGE